MKNKRKYLLLMAALGVFFIIGCPLPMPDTTNPTVISTVPLSSATGVSVSGSITATFSEAMDPATITTATFTLKQGAVAVAGTVSYGGNTATFNPSTSLSSLVVYTATVTTGAKDLAGNALAANKVWSFTTADIAAPTVSSTVPANGATAVAVNAIVTATFSEAMAPATIGTATFTLKQGVTAVTGTVSYVGVIATFEPSVALSFSTVYTATITTGVEDVAGNALAANKVWTFTTGVAPDTTAPTVTSTVPANLATGVAINANVTATFSEAMAPLTITGTSFTLMQGATAVPGSVAYAGTTATFNPTINLAYSTVYTATVTTVVEDLAGNALAVNKVWSFTTGVAPDITPPTVTLTVPINTATGVGIASSVTATFSEAMDPLTITTATFTLKQGVATVTGTVTYAGTTATFNPGSSLANSLVYTATITTGAKDIAGNALVANKVWTFTTAAATLPPVNLGTAGNYVILSKAGISTVPFSAITGDIGVSPILTTAITGFSLVADGSNVFSTSPQVIGSVYAADMAAPTPANLGTAVLDMGTAYTDAAGRPTPDFSELSTGNIGGLTLVPGLYKWTSAVAITTDVTLAGGATDVWIFQISGALTEAAAVSVNLIGGAQAKNVFWQVAGAVTLGANSHFEGVILGGAGITLGNQVTLIGRLYSETAVALDMATVAEPAP